MEGNSRSVAPGLSAKIVLALNFFIRQAKVNRDGKSLDCGSKTMLKRSGFVVFLLLGVLTAAMLAGGVFVYATRMPDPATADLRGVLRWLVTRDLDLETADVQEQLLGRIEQELRRGIELDGARDQLKPDQRAMLVKNADVLGRRWFFKQVDRYFAHSIPERLNFLNEQIDDIQKSGIAKALAKLAADGSNHENLWTSLSRRIQQWTAKLDAQHKAQAEQFVAAVQGNLFLRTLRASFSAS
jgi:hypothetical protein